MILKTPGSKILKIDKVIGRIMFVSEYIEEEGVEA